MEKQKLKIDVKSQKEINMKIELTEMTESNNTNQINNSGKSARELNT